MKNAKNIILKFFDKSEKLHITNNMYKDCVGSLFSWLLKNDDVTNDITTKLLFSSNVDQNVTARIITRKAIVVAGVEEVVFLLDTFTHLKHKIIKNDGDSIATGESIMEITGKPGEILIYERTLLNILQRLSGIATETHRNISYIQSLKLAKYPNVAATRKTVWSLLDKKAVAVGGGLTHRLALSDGILVKDNHLLLLEEEYHVKTEEYSAVKTLQLIMQKVNNTLIEIEIEKKESIFSLIKVFQTYKKENALGILLDNFTPDVAKQVINESQLHNLDNIVFEASGGINSENISSWAKSGVDIISLGALTHSSKAADISLEI